MWWVLFIVNVQIISCLFLIGEDINNSLNFVGKQNFSGSKF